MNTSGIKRKANIWKLRLQCWLLWAAIETEPAWSSELRTLATHYGKAKGMLNAALLRERERRMNKRVS